jgi:hypothetical protein
VIGPLASQSRPGVKRVEEAALELRLGRSVVYDLLERYRLRPQTSSLLPGKRGREPKLPILRQDREQLLGTCIQEFYLKPERPRLAALMLEVQRRFAEQSMSAPNYRTVCRRIESLYLRIATTMREGSRRALWPRIDLDVAARTPDGCPANRSHASGRHRGRPTETASDWSSVAYSCNRFENTDGGGLSRFVVVSFNDIPFSGPFPSGPPESLLAG